MSAVPDSSSTHAGTAGRRSDVVWSLLGRLGTTAANAVLMLALSVGELLDLHTFGVFVAFVGGQMLLSRAALAGQEQALVRLHGSGHAGSVAMRAGLLVVATLGGLTVAAGLGCLLLDPGWLPAGWSPWIMMLGGLAAAGTAALDAACASLLARLRYRRVGVLQSGFATFRALATIAAGIWGGAPDAPFTVFAAATAIGGGALLFGAIVTAGGRRGVTRAHVVATLRYGRWIAMADAAMVLAIQQGVFLLMAMGRREEAGRYGFALQFAQGLFAVYLATYHTLLPRATRLSRADLPLFLRRSYRTAGAAVAVSWVLAAGVLIILPMILEQLRPEYLGFGTAFLGLAGFVTALLLEAPLGVTCHALFSPRLHLFTMGVRCVAILLFGLWWVPEHGDTGAGLAQLAGSLVSLTLLVALLRPTLLHARGGHA